MIHWVDEEDAIFTRSTTNQTTTIWYWFGPEEFYIRENDQLHGVNLPLNWILA